MITTGKRVKTFFSLFALLSLFIQITAVKAAPLEEINRGLVAVSSQEAIYVGWRLLGDEPDSLAFNVYRITNGAEAVKVNDIPSKGATNMLDTAAKTEDVNRYFVRALINDEEQTPSDTVAVWNQNYLSIPLSIPTATGYAYDANDVSVGDLDGDGEYEIVLKWNPTNAKDNSQKGVTGNVYLDAYEMDGTQLWRIDLGQNIRAGAHYTQFMVYDLDGDGNAEVACKTAPGTIDGAGDSISKGPASSAIHSAFYHNSDGYILRGPEYLTVFQGTDGKEINTVNYTPQRGRVNDWGDDYGNRVDRFLACVAYLDGEMPSLVMCRGYYSRTVLAAWDFDGDTITQKWVFDTDKGYSMYASQGNHQLSVADVDEDGYDEIIYGSMAVDNDGTGLWNTRLGHGDAMHVTDILPERPGLEKWGVLEEEGPGSALLDARTGEILFKTAHANDVGRGAAADLDPESYGVECWGGTHGLVNGYNTSVGNYPSSHNHVVWWDGDLSRELLNDIAVRKYGAADTLLTAVGCVSNNGTKSNPCLQADLFGDWREEIIWRTADNSHLRVYTTTDSTPHRIKTLMHDHVYRMGIAWQNVGYNQPPHTGYYLGTGMFTPDSLIPPAQPRGLSLSSDSLVINLKWKANYEASLAHYFIYRTAASEDNYIKIDSVIADSINFTDSTVLFDVNYRYKITALDTNGNVSIYSEEVMGAATLRPDFPKKLGAKTASEVAFIYWTSSDDEVIGYNIYRSLTSNGEYIQINSNPIEVKYFADSDLTDSTTYYYVVTSFNADGVESFYSEELPVIPSDNQIYQAEGANLVESEIEGEHSGFIGSGYVNMGKTGSWVNFDFVYAADTGVYRIYYRYALGSTDRNGRIMSNGNLYSLTMAGTGAWSTYLESYIDLPLYAGFINTIRFRTVGNDFGNLDQIRIGERVGDISGISDIAHQDNPISIAPNPFSGNTTISIASDGTDKLQVEVLNLLGQRVSYLSQGNYSNGMVSFLWDGTDSRGNALENTVYIVRVLSDNRIANTARVVLVK